MSRADDARVARQLIVFEALAARKFRVAARAAVVVGARDEGTMAAALVAVITRVSLAVRLDTRTAAAAQFEDSTGVATSASGASDKSKALATGRAYVRTWLRKLHDPAQSPGNGGRSGGGGSSDDWDTARLASQPKLERLAAWDVLDTWNDEHRRNALAQPDVAWTRVWCAILDKHLCPSCRAKHGTKLTDDTPYEGWPPLHESCRCFVSTSV